MRLVLMRHADAGDADPARWPGDRERPLTDVGRREHARVAAALHRMGVTFDRILTSPLARARETAEIVASALGETDVVECEHLAPGHAPASVIDFLKHAKCRSAAVVGHEPQLGELVALMLCGSSRSVVDMKKASVACVEFDGPIGPSKGLLSWHLVPSIVESLH